MRFRHLARLLSRSNKALRDGIQLSEAMTGDGAAIFRHVCYMVLEGIVSKRIGSRYVSGPYARMAENEEPGFRAVIWATTRHLKYAQYAPTNNNRTNSPMVSMSERLMRQLMLERR